MKISKEITELAEKIRNYRINKRSIDELKIEKEGLENQIRELEESIKILKLNTLEQNQLLNRIGELEESKRKGKLNLEKLKEKYTFMVTTPSEASNTVSGEISRELSKSKEEVLICSPWITYIVDELSDLRKKADNKKVNIKIITRLIKEDVERGITDLDKFRVLKDTLGAEIRYNNDLHAKMMIIDNSIALLSSANLTKKGLSVNYEAGISIKDKEIVNKVSQFFNDIWKESKPLTEEVIKNILSTKEK